MIGIYAPNQNQTIFWDALKKCILSSNSDEVLILGDFNGTIASSLNRSSNMLSQDLLKTFFPMLSTWDLVDVWRDANLMSRDYSIFSHRYLSYSRIDMILFSRSLLPNIVNPTIELRHYQIMHQ